MATSTIEPERIRCVRSAPDHDGDVVVYWMQAAQRTKGNEALEYAAQRANELGLPLAVVFCVVPSTTTLLARHHRFMFEGLVDVKSALEQRGVAFTVFAEEPATVFAAIDHRMKLLVTDRAHLAEGKRWRDDVAAASAAAIDEVETNVVVPTDLVSTELESTARSIRPKINEHLDRFVVERRTTPVQTSSFVDGRATVDLGRTAPELERLDLGDGSSNAVDRLLEQLGMDPQDRIGSGWMGGSRAASRQLRSFCSDVLPEYHERRSQFDRADSCSRLSPYLHFGQISPVDVVRLARTADAQQEAIDAFVEEVVVRRELAINFVLHEPDYDRYAGLPEWARRSLELHADDERDHVYTAAEMESSKTHDEVWNAIMQVIREEGWVHNQLRMYWGKQIMRWTNTPAHAYRTLLELNNRYFLDGRDASSYANVGWCFGLHDRGFAERDVTGKTRLFTDQALRRKGDLDGWVEQRSEGA